MTTMRYRLMVLIAMTVLASCSKDKFESTPKIEYKSISFTDVSFNSSAIPVLTFKLTDAEGDLGPIKNNDTYYVYIKNNLTGDLDSLEFPDLGSAAGKNFSGDVEVNLNLKHLCIPVSQVTDTIFYDIYVKDYGKNKSNVITTPNPVLFRCF